MEFIDNIKRLGLKENRVYLFLFIWLLIAYTSLQIFSFLNLAIIGIIIYFPLLGFTSFLWFLSLFGKDIKQYSYPKLIVLLAIDFILMILAIVILVAILIVSIFSYIFFTSLFLLYGCYKAGKDYDEILYYKSGAWFWRRVEFWGGLAFSLIFLYLSYLGTIELVNMTNAPAIINIAYILVMMVIIGLAIYGLLYTFVKRLNAWLGTYFILVTIYTVYLVLKVFMGLTSSASNNSPSILSVIGLLFLDLFILIYSISSIIGKQGKFLAERFKRFKQDTLILWLIFSKAAWEFAVNYPYGLLGIPQALGITFYSEVGFIITLVTNISVLVIFIALVVIFGYNGIKGYGKEKERLKAGKMEILLAKKSGEREDHERPISNQIEKDHSEKVSIEGGLKDK